MNFGILVVVLIVSILAIFVVKEVVDYQKKKQTTSELEAMNFTSENRYISDDGLSGLAVDEKHKIVCIVSSKAMMTSGILRYEKNVANKYEVKYSDIISSEIIENGETITKTSRTSQVGGAIVGGVLLGGIGAVVGGLSGKTSSREKIKQIALRIIVNDISSPSHNIVFLNVETMKGGSIYNGAIDKARHWHGVIESVIRQADLSNQANHTAPASVADELVKLANLLEKSIISQSEFESQKQKLFSKS